MKTMLDKSAATELSLYIENTRMVYDNMTIPVVNNLKKKYNKSQYDKSKAVKAWEHVAEYGAKLYAKEFADKKSWYRIFNAETRRYVAQYLENVYFDEYIK